MAAVAVLRSWLVPRRAWRAKAIRRKCSTRRRDRARVFYDPKMGGRDWDAPAPAAIPASSAMGRSAAINAMLAELRCPHDARGDIDPDIFSSSTLFRFGLRDGIKKHLPYGVSYSGIGIFTREIDGKTFVTGVIAGLGAAKGGVLVGDEIIAANDKPFEPIGVVSRQGWVERKASLRRERDGPISVVEVRPERIEPGDAFRAAARRRSHHRSERQRIGYVHVWSYAGERYQDACSMSSAAASSRMPMR